MWNILEAKPYPLNEMWAFHSKAHKLLKGLNIRLGFVFPAADR